jgi:hypothetical protein
VYKFLPKVDLITGSIKFKCVIVVFIVIFMITSLSCSGKDSLNPFTPSCERNETAEVKFSNLSATGITMEIIWDGLLKVTLAPGQTSASYTENAGTHSSLFRNAATRQNACAPANPNLLKCTIHTFSCSQ